MFLSKIRNKTNIFTFTTSLTQYWKSEPEQLGKQTNDKTPTKMGKEAVSLHRITQSYMQKV